MKTLSLSRVMYDVFVLAVLTLPIVACAPEAPTTVDSSPEPELEQPSFGSSGSDDIEWDVKAWTFDDGNRCPSCGCSNWLQSSVDTTTVQYGTSTHDFVVRKFAATEPCDPENEVIGGAVKVWVDSDPETLLAQFEADWFYNGDQRIEYTGESDFTLKLEALPYTYKGCSFRSWADNSQSLGTNEVIYYDMDATKSGEILKAYFECE